MKQKLMEKLIVLSIAFPLVIKMALLVNPMRVGCDTWTHLYKAYVLKTQLETLPMGLWGAWDWSWHVGYEFLDVYSPLPYYCIVLLSLMGCLTLETSLRILIAGGVILGAFGMYYLCKEVTQHNILGFFGIVLFLYSPIFIIVLIEWGNVGKFIVYALTPLLLLFTEKLIKSSTKSQTIRYMFISGIIAASCILSNIAVGLWALIMSSAWVMFKSNSSPVKFFGEVIGITVFSFMLSAWFLLPMVYSRATFLPVISVSKLDVSTIIDVVFKAGVLSWIFTGLLSIVLLCSSRKKIDKTVKFFFVFLLLHLLYNIIAVITEDSMPSLSLIRGDRSYIVILILFAILPTYLLKLVNIKRKALKIIALIFIGLSFIQGMQMSPYYPLQYEKYFDAARFIAVDSEEWCRYAFLPREPIGAVLPQYSGKPYIDGWSFLSDPEIFSILGTPVPGLERIERFIIENSTAGLKVLKYLGVKYIIMERADPIYGYEFSNALYAAINSSKIATPRYMQDSVTVFEIKDFCPLHFYSEIPRTLDMAISQALPLNENLIITQFIQTERELSVNLRTSKAGYIVIPIVNSFKLETYVNDEKLSTFHAFGNLIAVYLPSGGEYKICVELKAYQPTRYLGAAISFLALIAGSVCVVVISWRSSKYERSCLL